VFQESDTFLRDGGRIDGPQPLSRSLSDVGHEKLQSSECDGQHAWSLAQPNRCAPQSKSTPVLTESSRVLVALARFRCIGFARVDYIQVRAALLGGSGEYTEGE